MPTYEYECLDCKIQFEEFQRISDPPISICPACSGKTKRIISGGTGFLFKGSGFYITENRSKNYKESVEKEKGSVAKVESKPKISDKKNK